MHMSSTKSPIKSCGKSSEWGRKARKIDNRLYRGSGRSNAIAEGLEDMDED